ncbi:MAG: lipopolysaccharide biosynthesis protein [Armatimonadota bacterium]
MISLKVDNEAPRLGHRQFAKNLAAGFLNLSAGFVASLCLPPFLIQTMGVAAYGLVPLANSLVAYLSLLTVALNSATGRFVTIAIVRGEHERALRIFNTALWGAVVIGSGLLVIGLAGAPHVGRLFTVPYGYAADARMLVLYAVVCLIVTTVTAVFSVSIYYANRLDTSSGINIMRQVTFLIVAFLLVRYVSARPQMVGLALLSGVLVAFALTLYSWRRYTPWLRVSPVIDGPILRELTGYGTWVVINQMGAIMFLSVDLLVVNRLLGAVPGGQYGALLQWPTVIRSLGGATAAVFAPTMAHLYAEGKVAELVAYCRQAIRLVGVLVALPVALLCGLAAPFLRLWLGDAFVPLAPLLIMLVGYLTVDIAVTPLLNLQQTMQAVKVPGIVTCVMGIVKLGVAVLLVAGYGGGMYSVAAVGAVVLTLHQGGFTTVYGARILGQRWHTFIVPLIPVVLVCVLIAGMGYAWTLSRPVAGWVQLITTGLVLSGIYILACWYFVLTKTERALLPSRIRALSMRVPCQK